METFHEQFAVWLKMGVQYAPRLIAALLMLVAGLYLVNKFTRVIRIGMTSRGLEPSLQSFLSSLFNVTLKVLLLLSCANMLGIETSSFVAVLGAAGIAVGLALQGSLSNFAGGVLTLTFKPYKVGDIIECLGQTGEVREILLFNTVLLTADHRTIVLPNGAVSNGTIINHSRKGNLRVEILLPVEPATDFRKVRGLIEHIMAEDNRILHHPPPFVGILKLTDGVMTLSARAFTATSNYWPVYFDLMEKIKTALDREGIQLAGSTKKP